MKKHIDKTFKTSTKSNGCNFCVAVKREADNVSVTGTKTHNKGKMLDFSHDEWNAFVIGVKRGEFDV